MIFAITNQRNSWLWAHQTNKKNTFTRMKTAIINSWFAEVQKFTSNLLEKVWYQSKPWARLNSKSLHSTQKKLEGYIVRSLSSLMIRKILLLIPLVKKTFYFPTRSFQTLNGTLSGFQRPIPTWTGTMSARDARSSSWWVPKTTVYSSIWLTRKKPTFTSTKVKLFCVEIWLWFWRRKTLRCSWQWLLLFSERT